MLRNDPSILTDHDAVGIGLDLDRAADGAGCDRVLVVVEAHKTGLRDRRRHRVEAVEPAGRGNELGVLGFECRRSEVSGARLWGWARDRFGTPQRFFERFFVANYCPLAFMEASGANRTPDKLSAAEQQELGWPLPASEVDRAESMRRRVAMLCSAGTSEDAGTCSL